MSEIKVGEYVRTKKGKIGKVCAYQDLTTYDDKGISVTFHSFDTDKGTIADIEVAKYSKNIIDLIEVGDILLFKDGTKWEVQEKYQDGTLATEWNLIENEKQLLEKISRILTKEQFNKESYKVGE